MDSRNDKAANRDKKTLLIGGRYEARKIFYIIIIAVSFWSCFTSCTTTATPGSNEAIIDHQRQIARLEEELRNRDRTVESAIRELDTIATRSSAMEGTVDEVIELFAEYQRRVEQLIRDYNKVRIQTINNEQDSNMAGSDSNSNAAM